MARVLVINPNSSKPVTQSMGRCLTSIIAQTRHDIECIELAKSPPGIETDAHTREVVPHILEAVSASDADAIVIACFSDPGIEEVRKVTSAPVFGIAQSAYLTAMGLGERFGIISMGLSSVGRHLRYLKALKFDQRLAGDRAINVTVPELMASNVIEPLYSIGQTLCERDGADVVILGCAGLGGYRLALQTQLGVPVVDPVQAGVVLALSSIDLDYGRN